jgi:hypothetical protein
VVSRRRQDLREHTPIVEPYLDVDTGAPLEAFTAEVT